MLLLPPPVGAEVDVLRRALGADDVDRLASHLTLVPPVNVRDDDMDSALDLLRDAAERTSPFLLKLGPPRTFLPTNPVLFLEVGGDVAPVDKVRDKVFRPPLERNLTWPFHPHVTLLDNGDEAKIRAAVDALADVRFECVIDRLHLLRESNDEGVRSWHSIAEARFGGPSIVGRGGLELELDVTDRLSLDAATWSDRAWAAHDDRHDGGPWPKVPLAVTARRDGRIVGTVDGDTRPNGEAYLAHVIVSPDVRGEGVGAHLVAAFSSAAAERGATFVTLRTEKDGPAVPFYDRLGFEHWYDLPRWRNDRDYVQLRRFL
ncbi:MAG: 2,5 ligase family [Actinomycetia bacterium]|nr:2,5 ligase family [Actinomycetes bacterium]